MSAGRSGIVESMRNAAWCIVVGAAALAGCRGPTRSVTLEVSSDGRPVPAAHVRAVALDTNDLPLPVTLATLQQAANALPASGVTDETGRVTLRLDKASAYRIEVAGALGSPSAVGSWVLSADRSALHEATDTRNEVSVRAVGGR